MTAGDANGDVQTMHFNACSICNHANKLTASSCEACGVGLVATCPQCGAVNSTLAHRCMQCEALLPLGEAAEMAAVGTPAPLESTHLAAALDPTIKVRFNTDHSVSIEAPDGRGGSAVYTVAPPAEKEGASPWLEVDQVRPLPGPEASLPWSAPAEDHSAVTPDPEVPAIDPQAEPGERSNKGARRAAAVALLILLLVTSAGFVLTLPGPAAWFTAWRDSGWALANLVGEAPVNPQPVPPMMAASASALPETTSANEVDAPPTSSLPALPSPASVSASASLSSREADSLDQEPPAAGPSRKTSRRSGSQSTPARPVPNPTGAPIASPTIERDVGKTSLPTVLKSAPVWSSAGAVPPRTTGSPTSDQQPTSSQRVCTQAIVALGLCNQTSAPARKD